MDVGQIYDVVNILLLVMIFSAILLIVLYGYLKSRREQMEKKGKT